MARELSTTPEDDGAPSLTEQLAGYWSGARYEDLPPAVVDMAKSVLLDTLAVAVRGAESEVAVATRKGAATGLLRSAYECPSPRTNRDWRQPGS